MASCSVVAVQIPPAFADFGLSAALSRLPPTDAARVRRKARPIDQLRALLSTALLHRVVFGAQVTECALVRTPLGRPLIPPGTRVHDANVSHHGEWVICAAVQAALCDRVGVDVVALAETPPPAGLTAFERHFSTRELALLASTSSAHFASTFAALWAAKEALSKAAGRGLRADFQLLDCLDEEGGTSDNLNLSRGDPDAASRAAGPQLVWTPTLRACNFSAAGLGAGDFCPPLAPGVVLEVLWCVRDSDAADSHWQLDATVNRWCSSVASPPSPSSSYFRQLAVFRLDSGHIAAIATAGAVRSPVGPQPPAGADASSSSTIDRMTLSNPLCCEWNVMTVGDILC